MCFQIETTWINGVRREMVLHIVLRERFDSQRCIFWIRGFPFLEERCGIYAQISVRRAETQLLK